MSDDAKCVYCGSIHDQEEGIFDEEVLDVVLKIRQAKTADEVETLYLDLATLSSSKVDPLNASLPEELHEVAEEYNEAYDAMMAASMKMARYVLRVVDAMEADHEYREKVKELLVGTIPPPAKPQSN